MDLVNCPESRFCVICYRTDSSLISNDKSENFKLFIRLLRRFVNDKTDITKFNYLNTITDLTSSHLGCCKECLNQTEEFCDVYNQYKCLQLQLEWKVVKLANIIKLANKVPSRISQVKKILQDSRDEDDELKIHNGNERLKQVQKFRYRLTKICQQKLKRSQPRVLVCKDVKLLQKPDQQRTSISYQNALNVVSNNQDEDKCRSINNPILTKSENEDTQLSESIIYASLQNQIDTPNIEISFPNNEYSSVPHNENIVLEDNPSNMDEEEIYEDLNPFADCNDPLDNFNDQHVDTTQPNNCSKTENPTIASDTISLLSALAVPDNIFNPLSETIGLSISPVIENVASTSQLLLQDLQVKSESVNITASNPSEKLASQPTVLHTNPHNDDNKQEQDQNINQHNNQSPQQKRYNLRQNRFSKFVIQSEASESESEIELTHQLHSTRSSSVSSSSHDEDQVDKKAIPKLNPNKIKEPKPGKYLFGYYPCLVVGCEQIYSNEHAHQTHFKLHKPGKYPCNFCSRVKTDVIKLGYHEHKFHSKTPPDPNMTTNRTSNPWACPRCLYQSSNNLDYDTHFAFTHFAIGDNPDSPSLPFNLRRPRRNKINPRMKIVECETCKKKIRAYKMEMHFEKFHDLSKIDAKDVLKCGADNCSAYFLKREQLRRHYISEHNIEQIRRRLKKRNMKNASPEKVKLPTKKYIKCEICKKTVLMERKQTHYKTWHDTTNTTEIKNCTNENCEAYFLTEDQLNWHLKSQHEKVFRCTRCKQPFPTHFLLYRHVRQKHGKTTKPKKIFRTLEGQSITFQCTFCKFTTKLPKTLAVHEARKHETPVEQEDSTKKQLKTRKCPRCPFQYKFQNNYLGHYFSGHLNINSENCPDACKMCSSGKVYVENTNDHFHNFHNTNLLDDPTKTFKCDFNECSAYFLKPFQLHCHKNKMHPMLNCLKCVKTFKTRRQLIFHLRLCQKPSDDNHPNLKVSCDYPMCTKKFHSKEEMQTHKIYGHPKNPKKPRDKNEICQKCGKKFISIAKLTLHLRVGHVERSLVCSECGKILKNLKVLDKHMIYHKGPDTWEYQCSECGKKCADKQKLEEHLRTHTKEKPFVCQFCGGKYAHRHNWRNHLKTKHGDEKGIEEIVGSGNKGNYLSRKGSKKGVCIMTSLSHTR